MCRTYQFVQRAATPTVVEPSLSGVAFLKDTALIGKTRPEYALSAPSRRR